MTPGYQEWLAYAEERLRQALLFAFEHDLPIAPVVLPAWPAWLERDVVYMVNESQERIYL